MILKYTDTYTPMCAHTLTQKPHTNKLKTTKLCIWVVYIQHTDNPSNSGVFRVDTNCRNVAEKHVHDAVET